MNISVSLFVLSMVLWNRGGFRIREVVEYKIAEEVV